MMEASRYYPNLLFINGRIEIDLVSDDEPTLLGRSPRNANPIAIGTVDAISDNTTSVGNWIRLSLFPGTRRLRMMKLSRGGSSVSKGMLASISAEQPRNMVVSW
jgi:hypothetical protein